MSVERVSEAYTSRAAEYVDLIGTIKAAAMVDRDRVLGWALGVKGRVLDVGCGPGQWTSFLASRGVDIEGIDAVSVVVTEARRRHPECSFRVGRAEQPEVDEASLGGVRAWYSLIHMARKTSMKR